MTLRVQILKDKFSQSLGLPFKELLPESAIQQAISELKIKYKKRLFDPLITLWAFLSQVLDTDKSCHNAVSKIIAPKSRRRGRSSINRYEWLLSSTVKIARKAIRETFQFLSKQSRRKSCGRIFMVWTKCVGNRWVNSIYA
ncbi:hypothetical protein GXM_08095 [Nostoc sphaeroides CCNUC1]|uniref:Uncharacterized protein n=1 Tax=Nostoc sphaeroides CCNUC1 TaxID=2653204 RepID=A0A5P8WDE8_9NOSO|nr:hypothetical protein GXM_08095 [Nostoc sphaeroides CCNUC1]